MEGLAPTVHDEPGFQHGHVKALEQGTPVAVENQDMDLKPREARMREQPYAPSGRVHA
jgi:hypothetical protein